MPETLRPMRDDEVEAWLAESRAGLVEELVAVGRDPDRARARVDAQYAEWFADGQPREGHRLYVVEQDGARVATAWLGPHPERPGDATVWWLYDIEVDKAMRGHGIGRLALRLAEDEARASGARRIELNVFGSNRVARALYESAGYAEVAVTLAKSLDSDGWVGAG